MNTDSNQEGNALPWSSKAVMFIVVVALGLGLLGGYFFRSVQFGFQNAHNASLSAGIVNNIGFLLEEYRESHGFFPESLNQLDLESLENLSDETDWTSKLIYLSSGESYELVLGIPSAVWIDEERMVRFR